MNQAKTVFASLLLSLIAMAQTPHPDLLQVEVESVNPIPDGFNASIRIEPDSNYALGVIGLPVGAPSSAFYIAPVNAIDKPATAWRKVADVSDDVADIAIHGDDLYLLTFKNAPRYKVIHLDARNPVLSAAEIVIPPTDAVLEDMAPAQDALYVRMLDGGIGRVLRLPYRAGAQAEKLALPFDGAVFRFRTPLPQNFFLLPTHAYPECCCS